MYLFTDFDQNIRTAHELEPGDILEVEVPKRSLLYLTLVELVGKPCKHSTVVSVNTRYVEGEEDVDKDYIPEVNGFHVEENGMESYDDESEEEVHPRISQKDRLRREKSNSKAITIDSTHALIAKLKWGKKESKKINLGFVEGEHLVFKTSGPGTVAISGWISKADDGEEDDDDEYSITDSDEDEVYTGPICIEEISTDSESIDRESLRRHAGKVEYYSGEDSEYDEDVESDEEYHEGSPRIYYLKDVTNQDSDDESEEYDEDDSEEVIYFDRNGNQIHHLDSDSTDSNSAYEEEDPVYNDVEAYRKRLLGPGASSTKPDDSEDSEEEWEEDEESDSNEFDSAEHDEEFKDIFVESDSDFYEGDGIGAHEAEEAIEDSERSLMKSGVEPAEFHHYYTYHTSATRRKKKKRNHPTEYASHIFVPASSLVEVEEMDPEDFDDAEAYYSRYRGSNGSKKYIVNGYDEDGEEHQYREIPTYKTIRYSSPDSESSSSSSSSNHGLRYAYASRDSSSGNDVSDSDSSSVSEEFVEVDTDSISSEQESD